MRVSRSLTSLVAAAVAVDDTLSLAQEHKLTLSIDLHSLYGLRPLMCVEKR